MFKWFWTIFSLGAPAETQITRTRGGRQSLAPVDINTQERKERIKWAGKLNTWIRSNFNEEFEYFPSCIAKLICSTQPSSALIWNWKPYCGTIL